MKTNLLLSLCIALVLPLALGCEPRPVVEQQPVVEEPAVDVNSAPPTSEPATTNENTGVDVQVGGGQGVQVDVNEGS